MDGAFPTLISPHQPFFDMAAITHQVGEEDWFEDDGEIKADGIIEEIGEAFDLFEVGDIVDASGDIILNIIESILEMLTSLFDF